MQKKGFLFFAIIFLAAAYSVQAAQVSFYMGDVKLTRKGKITKVAMNDTLNDGDMIKTGKNGVVEVSYKDGTKIQIKENSTAQIGSNNIKGSDNVSLISGNLSGKFAKLVKGDRKVYTPTTVCAVRGTEFKIAVSKGGDSRIDLTEGKINMSNPYGSLDLNEGNNAEINMAEEPDGESSGSMDEWVEGKDQQFDDNPSEQGDKMSQYMDKFSERSKNAEGEISGYGSTIGKEKNKDKLMKAGSEIQKISDRTQDDMVLNETARGGVDKIIDHYKATKSGLYDQFIKVKIESNKVAEQQMRNYKAIAEVLEAYKKAYEQIMNTYKQDFNKITDDKQFKDVLPKFDQEQ